MAEETKKGLFAYIHSSLKILFHYCYAVGCIHLIYFSFVIYWEFIISYSLIRGELGFPFLVFLFMVYKLGFVFQRVFVCVASFGIFLLLLSFSCFISSTYLLAFQQSWKEACVSYVFDL